MNQCFTATLKARAIMIMSRISQRPCARPFIFQANSLRQKRNDFYNSRINQPIDIQTIINKLLNDSYAKVEDWRSDMKKIATNAKQSSKANPMIRALADELVAVFEKEYRIFARYNSKIWLEQFIKLSERAEKLRREMPGRLGEVCGSLTQNKPLIEFQLCSADASNKINKTTLKREQKISTDNFSVDPAIKVEPSPNIDPNNLLINASNNNANYSNSNPDCPIYSPNYFTNCNPNYIPFFNSKLNSNPNYDPNCASNIVPNVSPNNNIPNHIHNDINFIANDKIDNSSINISSETQDFQNLSEHEISGIFDQADTETNDPKVVIENTLNENEGIGQNDETEQNDVSLNCENNNNICENSNITDPDVLSMFGVVEIPALPSVFPTLSYANKLIESQNLPQTEVEEISPPDLLTKKGLTTESTVKVGVQMNYFNSHLTSHDDDNEELIDVSSCF